MTTTTKNALRTIALGMGITTIVHSMLLALLYIASSNPLLSQLVPEDMQAPHATAADTRAVPSPFRYTFNVAGALNEAGSLSESSSPYFWLNSGGRMLMKDGVGSTVLGALPQNDFWRLLYSVSNPLDTGKGYYPQNIFRLLSRSTWDNASEEVRFNIQKVNMTDTPNRDEWSGVLLMSRYKDSDNLYYAGVRMDGDAVIKKKYKGTYTTLAQKPIPAWSASAYDRTSNPNLIPANRWMRLKTTTATKADGTVQIDLYLDENDDGKYERILSATDTSKTITGAGSMGLRTDYIDMKFDDLTITKI